MDFHQKKTLCFPDGEHKLHHLLPHPCIVTENANVNQAEKWLLQIALRTVYQNDWYSSDDGIAGRQNNE